MDGGAEAGTSSAKTRLEVVGELAALINTTYDLHEIFRAAILKLERVIEFRRASVLMVSEDRTSYRIHTLYDASQGGFVELETSFPIDRGLPGKAIRTGEAIRVDELSGTDGIRLNGEHRVSALIVPLRVDDVVIATLNLGAASPVAYGEEDLELAVLLGRQIESSLHYSKLLATIAAQREALEHEYAEARSQRARLEALIEVSDAAVLMVSEGRVVHANLAMAQLLGIPPEVVLGAPLERVNHTLARSFADPKAIAAQVSALEEAGSPLRDRVEFVFPQRLTCQRTVTTVRGPSGEVLGQLLLYRDVTREVEADVAKDEFVSMVSHELRTPMTSVKASLSLLGKGAAGRTSDRMQELVDIALRNLDRLIRLVDDLLDLSRIRSGRLVTTVASVSVGDTVARAVDAVRGFAADRQTVLECSPIDPAIMVSADPDRLEQVILNLLSNAIKFSPNRGQVRLRCWTEGESAVLEVADDGPGIPKDQLGSIFEKFHQLDATTARRHGGAGLGLAISRMILEELGGTLWAESDEGRGSRFFVKLPLASDTSA
ncbi:MAG: GAF domain-containing protein [Gemmatimonadota bacterium]|nr:MAG: GAF domain-containing protein [Gemmatimonadota bacterium]